ncbi:chemotaxis protein CheW [Halorientalis salina]|uniref:chemotaxis protein CheW n=1 Tax=Halorientalis salina TaxID=2932266 RepID=UPI0010AC457E|nr:chemotaxis protein CheW [Halorientalis salina]
MTEEDTDDDNDRMNRADRLREMREGRRQGRGDSDDNDTSEADDESTADGESSATDSAEDEGPSTTDSDSEADEPTTSDGDGPADSDTDSGSNTPEPPAADDRETGVESPSTGAGNGDEDEAVEESGFEFDDSSEKTTAHDEKAEKKAVDAAGEDDVASAEPQSGVAETVSSTDASSAIGNLNSGSTFAIPDQATTVAEDAETTLDSAEQSVAAARAAASRGSSHAGSRTRVLEFELGDERFCLDIDYIEEIVELENVTRVPNSPSYVQGVVDLRGQVTTIINPKDALEVDQETSGELIIVFDSEAVGDQGHLGWVVDEVRQVTPVADEEVNDSPDEDAEYINGIINREDEDDFVVWTTPELALNSS